MRIGLVSLVAFANALFAQQATPPAFEVALIKPSPDAPESGSGIFESNGRIVAKNVTLKRCIRGAYNIPEPQVVGGPDWSGLDRYYIEAKAPSTAGDHSLMEMLRTLLADRFKLVVHPEQRSVSGYRLVLAKNGLKAQATPPEGGSSTKSQRGVIDAKGCTLTQFALKLAEVLHRPVVDSTATDGRFDLKLEWMPDDMQAKAAGADAPSGPSIFSALQEQLGLKLESGKVPAQVLVIDSAEKPSAN